MKTLLNLTLGLLIALTIPTKAQQAVKIGNQTWMAKNLDVTTFQNGEIIPQAKNPDEWMYASESQEPAWCYYNFNSANGPIYGKLYNGYALKDPRGIAPKGWHVATFEDWNILTKFLGNPVAPKLKHTNEWKNQSFPDYNQSQFSAIPNGMIDFNGICNSKGIEGFWWSATKDTSVNGANKDLEFFYNDRLPMFTMNNNNDSVSFTSRKPLGVGCAIRCLKD